MVAVVGELAVVADLKFGTGVPSGARGGADLVVAELVLAVVAVVVREAAVPSSPRWRWSA